ncbi:MAG TPA: ABC transporter ATP-binding protein [Candidatus Saccharimonadales bacterium]|nr:ABC transporter ATP-binding protein [Candidatus Saccharimonadales bacterium]
MKSIWRIMRFTGSLWRYYLGISVFTILVAGMSQVIPLLTKAAIDEIGKAAAGGHVDVTRVAVFAILIFAVDMGQNLFSNVGGYIGDMLSAKQQRLLSNRYYQHVMSLPQRYFDTELTGTIINRMNRGIGQIATYTQVLSNNFLQFLFSTVFTLIIVAYYSWVVALILLSLYPIYIWLTTLSNEKWQAYQKEINSDSDIASGRFAESVSQVRVVKSFVQEAFELRLFDALYRRIVRTTSPQSKHWHWHDVLRRTVLAVINFALYAFIFIQTARGRYSIGTMVLLIQYVQLIRIPLFSISFLVGQTQRAIANSRDYFAVMDEEPEIRDHTGAKPIRITKGAIVFSGVDFGYEPGTPVLQDVSFAIKSDSKLALVGESGQGKTTITSLLLRLYEVNSGAITIDGQNINDVQQASLRQNIAVVFQEPALFSGTIHENIAYGRPDASQEDVVAAAKAANAHEFISGFEKGYDSEIGERGLKLSGGQKQRIAIARALLKDAPILILDEATSSLDTKSERLVQQALERLMKGRTTLIIAHRLSTIQTVDTIVTLVGGKVGETGSPHELAASGGIYSQLLALQQTHSEAGKKKLQQFEMAGE